MSVSAKYITCILNGFEVEGLTGVDADDSGTDRLDATSAKYGGYTATDTGCFDLDLNITLLTDLADGPFLNIQVGTLLEEVYVRREPEEEPPMYYLPLARVVSKPQRAEIRGRLEVTCRVKNHGPYEEDGVGG